MRIFVSPANGVVAVLTDLGDKRTGVPVTNAVEHFRQALVTRGMIDADARIIEHYEPPTMRPATFDLVSFAANGTPSWAGMDATQAAAFVGCTVQELEAPTLADPRLADQIDRIRNAIDPFIDFPHAAPAHVINRRMEIRDGMISRRELAERVAAGAGERELQALLRRDPSLLAEVYARPSDEYICFSELPVADGFVDFALFTSRSRIDVVLIEIKGADFDLVTRDASGRIAYRFNEATQQIRRRMGDIYRHLWDFRTEMHRIRQGVEAGEQRFNAFVGPWGRLHVDPEKDIELRGVVIAGRSRDDREESRERHNYEMLSLPPVKVESWDSWLRKLQRE